MGPVSSKIYRIKAVLHSTAPMKDRGFRVYMERKVVHMEQRENKAYLVLKTAGCFRAGALAHRGS